jgi:hypothetical protein
MFSLLRKRISTREVSTVDRFESFLNKIQDLFKNYCKYRSDCQYFDPANHTCANNEHSYCGKYRDFEAEALKEAAKPEQM